MIVWKSNEHFGLVVTYNVIPCLVGTKNWNEKEKEDLIELGGKEQWIWWKLSSKGFPFTKSKCSINNNGKSSSVL